MSDNGIPGGNHLLPTLANRSVDTLDWMRERAKVPLNLVGRLGGQSFASTRRPTDGVAGSEIVVALEKQLKKYKESGQLTVMKNTKAISLTFGDDEIKGVYYEDTKTGHTGELSSPNVILATGGYASDFTDDSLLNKYRPDLQRFATTNGKFSTGDGHKMAAVLGASMVDMEHVQVHPTGFIDPKDKSAAVKTLCDEILRGVGGLLLPRDGNRFVDELGTRDYVTARMLEEDPEDAEFLIVVSDAMATEAEKHIGLYSSKGLLSHYDSLEEVATFPGLKNNVTASTLATAILSYNQEAISGLDNYGKTVFNHVPVSITEGFWIGTVTPVIHYTMGGIQIDSLGHVLRPDGSAIDGLFAAGEIVGGLHGKNRLGMTLQLCACFGVLLVLIILTFHGQVGTH